MTDKEQYRELCTKEPSIPIFSRDWWLDCVCGENQWDVLLYFSDGCPEAIEAAFPFYTPYKKGITMPAFTQTMGIWFNPNFGKENYSKNLLRKQNICEQLIRNLPEHTYFIQNFHYLFTDWLPFYWKGYRQTTRYTYILPDIQNIAEIEKNRSYNIRQNIHKARTKYQMEMKSRLSADSFLEINAKTYERQRKKAYQSKILRRLIETAYARNQGNTWGAFDPDGRLHAAVFVVWQENCAYYIAGGSDPIGRKSGAHLLVLSEAIRAVSNVSASFDFEGSMIPGVERVFRSFGALQKPYFTISKGNRPWIRAAVKALRNCFSTRQA
ncbi:MAG: GNAT family N-acetyltransferase [Candidatus Azobacteroides sp.]|nr:GNAT family N-acetyltransferase [Candidatus Azobacteroides sp.]